jgi:putative N6-adenine-specific DNA methylase
MPDRSRLGIFVATAPGLEALARDELRALGIRRAKAEPGGVAFSGQLRDVYAANLHLRTASRVVLRLGSFRTEAFHELERRARRLAWSAFVSGAVPVRLRVTCRKSRLYHSDGVAERVFEAITRAVPDARQAGGSDANDDDPEAVAASAQSVEEQLVTVRLLHDVCTISVDTSGELLHRRGYRQAVAKAPLRETLAAACLVASEWNPKTPLLDPLCGSGTIAIEGAMMARGIAPGLARRFAFMDWGDFDSSLWNDLLGRARAAVRPACEAAIIASDRDAGAIDAARANAERAGVSGDIELSVRAVSAIDPPSVPGSLVSNPPYGVRVGERDRLRNLYAQFGNVIRAKLAGWRVSLLFADRDLERQMKLRFHEALQTSNGGLRVRLLTATIDQDR